MIFERYQFWYQTQFVEQTLHHTQQLQLAGYLPPERFQNDFCAPFIGFSSPEHWRYSSARSYLGGEGLLEIRKPWT